MKNYPAHIQELHSFKTGEYVNIHLNKRTAIDQQAPFKNMLSNSVHHAVLLLA